MLILIEKDTATRIPKECSIDEAKAFGRQFPVHVVMEDGGTMPLDDHLAAQPQEAEPAKPVDPAMIAAAQERGDFAATAGPLPRAAKYLSRYERGFLTYLEQTPGAAALLRSA